MIGISFSICCLVFLVILMLFYFSKQRIESFNNKLFTALLLINFIGVFIDVGGFVSFKFLGVDNFINILISKVYLVYYLLYIFVFMIYIYNVSTKKAEDIFHKALIAFIIVATAVFVLPIELYFENNIGYSSGLSVNFAYMIAIIMIIIMFYYLIKNVRNIGYKQYIPLFAFVALTIVTMLVQELNPEITLLLLTNTVVTYLMYFTIENPDVKMLEELYKNKKIIDDLNEENSRLLFRMTQDIKNPVNEITKLSRDVETDKMKKDEMSSLLKQINNKSIQIDYLINKTLNISNMDTGTIKVYDSSYNINRLFDEISKIANASLDNVEFNYTIAKNIPTYLYGDSVRIKQAITSLIDIAKSFTDNGFISLDVNAIVKYSMCRLIITMEDSGRGISIDRVNEILSFDNEKLSSKDIEDGKKIDIFGVKKIINMIGGSFMIKSELEEGTVVTITLDQKVVDSKKNNLTEKLEAYEDSFIKAKRVLVIDDDSNEIKEIEKILVKQGIDVTSTIFDKDAIDKIKNKVNYDLIFLDDELNDTSALEVLGKLKKIKGFNIPVIVILDDNKDKIKLNYLKEGFKDYIIKSKLKTEIERILKRF